MKYSFTQLGFIQAVLGLVIGIALLLVTKTPDQHPNFLLDSIKIIAPLLLMVVVYFVYCWLKAPTWIKSHLVVRNLRQMGDELFERKIASNTEFSEFQTDFERWKQRASDEIRRELARGEEEAESFNTFPVKSDQFIRAYNNEHAEALNFLWARIMKMRVMEGVFGGWA